MQKNSWVSPKTEFKFTLCKKKSFVISDFTYTLLPISGSPTCQERPKCSALVMKKCRRNRGLGLLPSGLTSSAGLFVFWGIFEKHPFVFLKPSFLLVLFHQWEVFSPEWEKAVSYPFSRIWNIPQVLLCCILPSITSCIFFSYFSFSPFVTFLSSSLSYSGLPSASVSLN